MPSHKNTPQQPLFVNMLRGESDEGPHPKREDEQVPLFTCCMVTLQARDPLRLSLAIRAQVQNLSMSRVKRGILHHFNSAKLKYLTESSEKDHRLVA